MCKGFVVPAGGLEPPRPYRPRILSPLCLPFHHAGFVFSELILRIQRNQGFYFCYEYLKLCKMFMLYNFGIRK